VEIYWLATGNITATGITPILYPSGVTIDASNSPSSVGGQIVLAAGVIFTVTGPNSPFAGGSGQISCTNCSANYAITGPSPGGGGISLGR